MGAGICTQVLKMAGQSLCLLSHLPHRLAPFNLCLQPHYLVQAGRCAFSTHCFYLGTQALEVIDIFLSFGTHQEHLLLRKPVLGLTENTKGQVDTYHDTLNRKADTHWNCL